ncbi:GNAT family N-acetyltransferase [Thermoanaerobacterium sp. RBIITD]|uniref:GNAT family N-acetyltransferase n=1 Tax=Thermoanaerobacterium sp. RBIITD TaxID=1550240 RepID=UPI000BB713DF|nr:GNAT family N-acetyltransferase [Thermoanaerobacterium sp. RBIITD]SNX53904.1 Acetyltransferase (GNAT) family protein [Thermoanaerobacterium sp. RBIITD]
MIRKGCLDDQLFIMGIIHNAIIDMEAKGIYQWDSIYPNDEVINNDLSNETLYVYEDGGIIKGIIVLNEYQDKEYEDMKWEFNSGKHLIIHRLCIDPKYQGQGIARLLVDYAEQQGKALGYESIRLDAFVNNERACNLYKKLGYKAVGIVEFRKGKFYCFEKGL